MRISKNFYIALLGLATAIPGSAQTILQENFETGNTGNAPTPITVGSGWTTVNGYTGTNSTYNWYNYYTRPADDGSSKWLEGSCCAAVDCPIIYDEDGSGPREEILLSPEINLNDTYQLQFTFKVSPQNAYESSKYDIQVRVVENDNLNGAETVFSIQNEKMLREAGISVFPISTWDPRTARIDLSDFKGSKVKLAFVYKLYTENGNSAWIDDISVTKFTPATAPQAHVNLTRNNFGTMYVGEKMYSEMITLTNTGKDGLKITGMDLPAGIGTTLDADKVDLLKYQHVDFHLTYTASTTSPASGKAVIHTTGGDVTIDYSATKQAVPEGYTLENFEEYFPPAGWTSKGWSRQSNAFEGDWTAYCSGDFSVATLRSPRIDLTDGGKVSFSYYNSFEEDGLPEYDVQLQVSYDGGDNWVTKWTAPYETQMNELVTVKDIDLGLGDENCYIRWMYPAVETDDEGAMPHSTFFLDRVLLPNLYGVNGTPLAASIISPANRAENVYNKDIVLEWAPAQFAKGYKLYVGTNREANDLIDGLDLGNTRTYTIKECANETQYRWKVVAYNDKGDSQVASTWFFTTQPDASVSKYPYEENFVNGGTPLGWNMTPSKNYAREWEVNSLKTYKDAHAEYNVLSSIWLDAGDSNAATTQEFNLPGDKNMYISFIWGDEHPASLIVDETGLVKKENVSPNNGISYTDFEIYADGSWTKLSTISEKSFDGENKYWHTEKIDLTPYKGKKVQFRWVHNSLSSQDGGASLTHIVIDEAQGDMASFNRPEWNAGKVNYEKALDSGEIFTLINTGTNELKVKDASFKTANFTTSLKSGDVIASGEGKQFSIRFDALKSEALVSDELTVTFESGYSVSLPVSGDALFNGVYYYSFEPNPLDYEWDKDWTMIDADGGNGYSFSSYWVHYSKDGQKCAFSVESDSKEDGMYGMMAPISGMHALVGSSPQNKSADNWIISKKVVARAGAKFDFYARNWESLQSVLPDPKHRVTVLVSTAGNTDTNDFKPVMRETEMEFLDGHNWHHFTVDLSEYAEQPIYIALRHTTNGVSNLAFFDDFTIDGVDKWNPDGVKGIEDGLGENDFVEVYNLAGVKVAEGTGHDVINALDHGFYVVKVNDGTTVRAFRIAR